MRFVALPLASATFLSLLACHYGFFQAPSAHSSCLDLPFRVYYGIEGLGVGMVASVGNAFQAYGLRLLLIS